MLPGREWSNIGKHYKSKGPKLVDFQIDSMSAAAFVADFTYLARSKEMKLDFLEAVIGKNDYRQVFQSAYTKEPETFKSVASVSQYTSMLSGMTYVVSEEMKDCVFRGSWLSNFHREGGVCVEQSFQIMKCAQAYEIVNEKVLKCIDTEEKAKHEATLQNVIGATAIMDAVNNCSYLVEVSRWFLNIKEFDGEWKKVNTDVLEHFIRKKVALLVFADRVEKLRGWFICESNPFDGFYGSDLEIAPTTEAVMKLRFEGAALPPKFGKNMCGEMYRRAINGEEFANEKETGEIIAGFNKHLDVIRASPFYKEVKKIVDAEIAKNAEAGYRNVAEKFKKDMMNFAKKEAMISDGVDDAEKVIQYDEQVAAMGDVTLATKRAMSEDAPGSPKRARVSVE